MTHAQWVEWRLRAKGVLEVIAQTLREAGPWKRDTILEMVDDALARMPPAEQEPIPMLLWCPGCHQRHIDEGPAGEKPHRTHACQHCGLLWQPALVQTTGVQYLPGCKNEPPAGPPAGVRRET